jgi:thioredoxin reductase (NADPH)
MDYYDVAVIGQGYAGLIAARLAVQRGLRTANFEAEIMGGLIVNVNELDPVPEGAEHSGAELASNLAMSNMESGVVPVSDAVTGIERGEDGLWMLRTESEVYAARHVVVASGARLRKLGVPGETEFFGKGVSECADCDGPLYQDMHVVVIGGGDSAFQEALTLCEFATKVTMMMRGDKPRARADLLLRAAGHPKLVQMTRTRVLAVMGTVGKGVEGLRIQTDGAAETLYPCSGVFVFIGLEPNAEFLPGDLSRDVDGALKTSAQGATSQAGLWAIGAVRSGFGGMLSDAAADAERTVAALS